MCRPVRCTESRGRPEPAPLSAVRTRRRRRANRESLAILLLLPFLAEDILAAIADALALVGLGLAPAADLGGELPDLLLVDAADLDRGLIGGLGLDALGNFDLDVMAEAELEPQFAPLSLRTIADAGDFLHRGVALRHAFDQVRHQRPLHAPEGLRARAVVRRLDRSFVVAVLVFVVVGLAF